MTSCGKVNVIGAGGHAKVVVRALQELGFSVAAVFDDDREKWGQSLLGVPIVGPVDSVESHEKIPAVLAIGDNALRMALAMRLDLEWFTVVHPSAFVDSTVVLGPGTAVLAGAVVEPDSRIGKHAIINTAASVNHDGVVGDFAHIAPGVHLAGEVAIGEGAFVGIGATAIQGTQIGAWSTIGAGAAVIRDLPDRTVAVGVPAKPRQQGEPEGVSFEGPKLPIAPTADEDFSSVPSTLQEAEAKERAAGTTPRIYLSPPHMSPRERELLLDAFDSNWIAPLGPHVDQFEREFAAKVGTTEAVALSSGTAALHLSMLLLGVGQGDEVFTSSLTFVATANAITYVGARPVFIDSDRESWNIDPELLGKELEASVKRGKLPKAVIAVDLYGQCADYDRIVKTCEFYGVPLIEDAAEALGATYQGKSAGRFGAMGIFSFNGNKIITASGGGMLVTDRKDWAEKARYLATQARDPAPHYQHSEIGYNYRMSNLLAAVGRGQLGVLEERVDQRRANFDYYRQALADVPGIRFMPELSGGRSTRWLTCITIDPEKFGATAEEIRLEHERRNIESRPLWKPMHLQPVFADCRMCGGAVAEDLFRHGLCLPSGSSLSSSDRERVVEAIRSVCNAPTVASRVSGKSSQQPAGN